MMGIPSPPLHPVVHRGHVVPVVGTTLQNGVFIVGPHPSGSEPLLVCVPDGWHRDDVCPLFSAAGFTTEPASPNKIGPHRRFRW